MRRRVSATLLSVSLTASSTFAGEWTPPPVVTTWNAYQAAYPKKAASAAALEIEGLASRLGLDAAPMSPMVADPDDSQKLVRLRPDDGRERPDPEFAKRMHSTISAVGQWAEAELSEPSERVGPPSDAVARFFDDNGATLDSIVAVAAGTRPIEWDLDAALRSEAPLPGLLGLTRLARLLAARALVQARAGDDDGALATIDGMWRLAESLAEQPYLISQLIATSQARLVVGLLRKVGGPAFGWEQRLRQRAFYEAFLAAFQNDPWPMASDPGLAPTVETIARIDRRFAEGLVEKSACDWTKDTLTHAWEVASSAEESPADLLGLVAWDTIVDMIPRSQRLLLDSELTALILQARAEKAASREGEWPARLPNLESSVCPGRFYSYRRSGGGVTIGFDGPMPAEERRGLFLPVAFRGLPPPTPTPTRPPVPTPTPSS